VRVRKPNPFLFLVVLIAALAAGCGTVTSVPRAAAAATAVTAAGQRSAATPKERAAAAAKAIFGQFVPPPGAVRLPKQPALPDGSPVMVLASTQADVTGYWRVSGTATALLAWEKAHIARGFARQDVIIGPPSWNTVYTLPAVPGVLPEREMNVQFYQEGSGQTVIMAEAMVSWQSPQPAAAVIPAVVPGSR
jgi:hypothetical protein